MIIKTNGDIEVGSMGEYLFISKDRQDEISRKIFYLFIDGERTFHKALEKAADEAKTNEELFFIAFNVSTFMSKFGKASGDEPLKKLVGLLEMMSDSKPETKKGRKIIN